jgi:hypothetical protein
VPYIAGELLGDVAGLRNVVAGLYKGGFRFELGNWKQNGQWFFPETTVGPHFHFGRGPNLWERHLPWQWDNWYNNLASLIQRGEAGEDLANLGTAVQELGASITVRSNLCKCTR